MWEDVNAIEGCAEQFMEFISHVDDSVCTFKWDDSLFCGFILTRKALIHS